ncbi:MAG: NAD-dependent epimerase/dehydratase family protein [Xanthomonadales bacterium]|nr:NAD-dependent epimerase/dehydratase family protein [Xanthomonadales bacterium]
MTSRRKFIALTTGALAASPLLGLTAAAEKRGQRASRPLSILVLGGTGFLGPHQIEYALARGHRVTMFNRGSNAGMYGETVEELVGNRDANIDAGLSALAGDRSWDVVIDNSGYVPRHVRDSAELLKDRCGRYLYISTVAVYDFEAARVFPESAKLAELTNPQVEEVTGETYGPLKAECDRAVRQILGDRCTVVRPTYVVGPGDHTDRFTYWVDRVDRGGDILAPSGAERPAQWVDARDLCPWVITLAENDRPGIFNAAGPTSLFNRSGLMWGLRALTPKAATLHWPSDSLLAELDIDLPMMARDDFSYFENGASMTAGLRYRSLADTATDTLAWWRALPAERRANPQRWPTPEQEQAAIRQIRNEA